MIRRSVPSDREAILSFVAATGFFRPDEVDVAREVLDDALKAGPSGHYQSYTAEADGHPAGWICFGPTPCTVGTFDLYWIVVAPGAQRKGLGAALVAYAEDRIRDRGGRLAVAETSGRPLYEVTRSFYRRCGYEESCRAADFYAPGDDKILFVKRL